jgi:HD-GYP domain-containing protein (c-di-GMP phosphodiesterase class II)
MRRISIHHCKSGMRLARPIYDDQGHVLLAAEKELSDAFITRLQSLGIHFVYIHDPRTADIIITDPLSDETRAIALQTIQTSFKRLLNEPSGKWKFSRLNLGREFRPVLNMILGDLHNNQWAMSLASNMYIQDHYLFSHSLNVCLYSLALGMAKGFSKQELWELGLGSLMHDIGKTMVPQELFIVTGKFTPEQYEQIKKHTEYGFEILRKQEEVPLLAAHCAYQHHERWNGEGYPRQLKEGGIHDLPQWVALADVFDALTHDRLHRPAILPHEAMEKLYSEAGIGFNKDKVEFFRNCISLYPIGTTIRLNTGESGVVVDVHRNMPGRPVVRILSDSEDLDLSSPHEIDLSKNLTLSIVAVLDN